MCKFYKLSFSSALFPYLPCINNPKAWSPISFQQIPNFHNHETIFYIAVPFSPCRMPNR